MCFNGYKIKNICGHWFQYLKCLNGSCKLINFEKIFKCGNTLYFINLKDCDFFFLYLRNHCNVFRANSTLFINIEFCLINFYKYSNLKCFFRLITSKYSEIKLLQFRLSLDILSEVDNF